MTDLLSYTYLIIGGGMAADSAAKGVREIDPDGSIGIVAQEETPPAARPALSKKLWTDPSFTFDDVWLNTRADTGAVLHARETAVELNRDEGTVRTVAGTVFSYDHLLLATGGTPRRIDLPEDGRVIYFRTVTDYLRLRELSGDGAHIAVVGGSFIGTELAAALVQNDTRVTLIHPESVLGGKIFPAQLAQRFQDVHHAHGVTTLPDTTVDSGRIVQGGDDESRVELVLSSGNTLTCDAVAVGLGIAPNSQLAQDADLELEDDGGIVVDDRLRTSERTVLATGDIASYPDLVLGRTRVEHVDNATTMGHAAGRNLAGADEPYTHTPYFYSAIFSNRYEAVGTLDSSLDTVENWSDDHDRGVVHYIDGDRVVGVLLWNISGRRDDARTAIAEADPSDTDALRTRIPLTDASD